MKKLRMGIIGVGGIATYRHIPAYMKLTDKVNITAICDVNEQLAKEKATAYAIPNTFQDYRDMFDHVDAVTVCTPNKFHAEITVAALEAGLHVLCEKPMAMTIVECEAMIDAAKKSGKTLSIGYHYRFMKEAVAAKKAMTAGDIGRPLVVRAQALRRRKVPGWGVFTNKQLQGGGCLIDYGCHLLDLSLWLMGNPQPLEVTGRVYNVLSKTLGQVNVWGSFDHTTFDVDDHVAGFVRFDNSASLLFETSWAANIPDDVESLSISGDLGGLDVFPFQLNEVRHGMLLNSEATWIPGADDPGFAQAENFIAACFGETDLIVQPEEARHVSQIIEAIYTSSATGKSVSMNQGEDR